MFRVLDSHQRDTLTITIDGEPVVVPQGVTVAAALLLAGIGQTRTTPVSGAPRSAYCHIGVCFECLVEIDGDPNCQGCRVLVHDGMAVRLLHGARDLAP